MKIYFPQDHYSKSSRRDLFPLLKAFIKSGPYSDTERLNSYGVSVKDFQFTNTMEEADVVILTMSWNYYVLSKKESQVELLISEATRHKKKIFIVINGDFGFDIPDFENVVILRASGTRSKLNSNHVGMPVFFHDPLKKWYNSSEVFIRSYEKVPTVGFCGQVSGSYLNMYKEIIKSTYRNIVYHTGQSKRLPQKIQSTSMKRYKYLKLLEKSKNIKTNFIKRNRHGGGIDFGRDNTPVAIEFFDNLKKSDYVLCYRGSGNFSVRFYETLAMGRIPLFINSDCILPLSDKIDWKKHVVLIEESEVNNIANRLIDFHSNLSPEDFKKMQLNNHKLWHNHLSFGGYFKTVFA